MGELVATPLCPAEHLPHRGGDWLVALTPPHLHRSRLARLGSDTISPLVGEMPGRAEGGGTHPLRPETTA
jgi:hypothetical protein